MGAVPQSVVPEANAVICLVHKRWGGHKDLAAAVLDPQSNQFQVLLERIEYASPVVISQVKFRVHLNLRDRLLRPLQIDCQSPFVLLERSDVGCAIHGV